MNRHDPIPSSLVQQAGLLLGADEGQLAVHCLVGDGSDRRFYRFQNGSHRAVGLWSPRKTNQSIDENDSYFLIGTHLHRQGLPVPRFLWADLSQGLFLLEDLGDSHLQRVASRARISHDVLYRRVVMILLKLHERAPVGFEARFCFDEPVYDPRFVLDRELEYFRRAFLVSFLKLDVLNDDGLSRDFEHLAEKAGVSAARHVIHRDFQSRNLMVHGGRLGVLDFQGMRYGPPTYDLASLLIDPYVNLSEPLQADLVRLYWQKARGFLGVSPMDFQESYGAVRLCRNLQALAAYAFLGLSKGKTQFLTYIPRAWLRLRRSLHMAGPDNYPSLSRCLLDQRLQRLVKESLGKLSRDIRH